MKSYLTKCSIGHRLHEFNIPTFFLSSNDDPIMGNKVIPYDKCYKNILLGVTKAGGHLGYFEGTLLPAT